jgi:hypothetical protein
MGASLTLARGLMLPLIIAGMLLTALAVALAVVLASADPASLVANVQPPFRWS